MKKKYLILMLLAVVAIGSYLISGTYAKYTSKASGVGTAQAAKWSFKVGGTEIANATPQTLTFNLFSSVKEDDTTSTEEDVVAGKIAPGTGGSFDLSVQNTSEVTATYTVALSEVSNNNIPIEYKVGNGNWETDLTKVVIPAGELKSGAAAETVTVNWRWQYSTGDAGDTADTAIGIAAQTTAPKVEISATVVATQKN